MATVSVRPLGADDHAAWLVLAQGYKEFYKTPLPPEAYDTTWRRILAHDGVSALGATLDGRLVGLAHFFFHTAMWTPRVCYLEDLFVDPAVRGRGVARALIEAVADTARKAHATRFYWSTHESNATARALYDRVAKHRGFIRYDHPLTNG